MSQSVFSFGGDASHSDPRQKDKKVTGGKGANLAVMAEIGLPVPPGFTIATEECLTYLAGGADFPQALRDQVAEALRHVERTVGKVLGDPEDPLLVSVRSGAAISMPGMMDTVLNLGLNDATVEGLARTSGDPRFAWDSYRRFVQMYSDVVLGVDHGLFEEALEIVKEDTGFYSDTELEAEHWQKLVAEYKAIVERELGQPFPQDAQAQLWGAIAAVFDSWDTERAKIYRRLNDIPHDMGTAVNVQAMVFGNMGDTSATGVARRNIARVPAARRQAPTSPAWKRRCPRPMPSSPACSTCSRRTMPTCRISSSPCSRASCGCSRPAMASARPRPRSRWRWTWSEKA